MELKDAYKQASSILVEELTRPTVTYAFTPKEWLSHFTQVTQILAAQSNKQPINPADAPLEVQRRSRPRHVQEHPEEYGLKGVNYELMLALYTQLSELDRASFLDELLKRVGTESNALRGGHHFPSWGGNVSDLPLIAELCVRTRNSAKLFAAIAELKRPNSGLAILLKHIEEMIALNFTLFSVGELEEIPLHLAGTRAASEKLTWQRRRDRGSRTNDEVNPHYVAGYTEVATEVVDACDAITTECQQARYWYVKRGLQQSASAEIGCDKLTVTSYLKRLGFSDLMIQTLDAAEALYKTTATPFELKSCLGHLRSFLEELHRQAAKPVASTLNVVAPPDEWGKVTSFLRQSGFITPKEEALVTSLYTLISDQGVHPLIAEQEYARLLRNMVIEYGLLFLTVLERKGISLL